MMTFLTKKKQNSDWMWAENQPLIAGNTSFYSPIYLLLTSKLS